MKITRANYFNNIAEAFEEFTDYKSNSSSLWADMNTPCADFSLFADFTRTLITSGDDEGAKRAFKLIENFLTSGNEEIKNAVATCCLENLANAVSAKELEGNGFTSYLGTKSRGYILAWDKFTGVKTNDV